MPIGSPLSITLPTAGGSSGTWGTELNTALSTIIAAVEGKVVPGALNLNATVDFQNQIADRVQQIKGQNLTATKVAAGDENSHYFVDGDFYVTDGSGNAVRITNSGSINVAVAGGFTGDYGAGTEEAQYSNSSKLYSFLQASAHRAKIDSAEHRLYQESASVSNYVALKSPSGLAASYSWIYPTALPSSGTELVTITSAGQVDTTADPTVDSVTTTDITCSNAAQLSGGAKFKATSPGNDTLDYFASTNYTPTLYINGTAFAGSYNVQEGHYVRIGDLVSYTAYVETDTTFSMSADDVLAFDLPHSATFSAGPDAYFGVVGVLHPGSDSEWGGGGTEGLIARIDSAIAGGTDRVRICERYKSLSTSTSGIPAKSSGDSVQIGVSIFYKAA